MPHRCTWIQFDGNRCNGTLIYSPPDEPWCDEHYICDICDSTYHTCVVDEKTFYCAENGQGRFFCDKQCDECKDAYKKFIDAI